METKSEYLPIDLKLLKLGELTERPLYVYLPKNQRYVKLVQALHPLEESTLKKIQNLGKAFSTMSPIEEGYPKLVETEKAVRTLCDHHEIAPFEKNKALCTLTEWLLPHALSLNPDIYPLLIFVHRTFKVPKSETLIFVSNLSVEMYERSLRVSAVSAMIALWLGFTDTTFISQFIETVFCEEVGRYLKNEFVLSDEKIKNTEKKWTSEALGSGQIPGVLSLDQRFRCILELAEQFKKMGDELVEIVDFSRAKSSGSASPTENHHSRVAIKLKQQFGTFTEDALEKEAA